MQLTQEQQSAALHNSGHARMVAVAGAGKTATLLQYLMNRMHSGGDPKRILVLMYNRAVKEAFEQKLSALSPLQKPTIRTFHSLGLKIYQGLIDLGFLPRCSLNPVPSSTTDLLIKQLLQTHHQTSIPHLGAETLQEWVETSANFIQLVKCNLDGPEITFKQLGLAEDNRFLIELFDQFEEWRKESRVITYDDMLYDTAKVFETNPESQSYFKNKLTDILVDEYQDINPIQHFLLKVISGERANVVVIGDPDQTIYEFRGSSPSFINSTFSQDFKSPTKYSLSQTFRFGHQLALAANHLITHNNNRDAILTISADTTPNTKIHLAETDNHGTKIASAIHALKNQGASYSGMAVLCRLWSFARPVELALMTKGIPYAIEGEQSILQCWEIRPLMHLLNILSGDFFSLTPEAIEEGLFDLLSIPSPKIAHSTLRDIAKAWSLAIDPKSIHSSLYKVIPKGLSSFQSKVLGETADALKCLTGKLPAAIKIKRYAKNLEFQQKLKTSALNPTKGLEHVGTVNAFLQFIQSFGEKSASEIVASITTMKNTRLEATAEAVTITTIHRSKGREWPAVFIPDVTEGHIPYFGSSNENFDFDALESERRLMYVAITRAQKQLFLTTSVAFEPDNKSKDSNEQPEPSRFIQEMALESCKKISEAIQSEAPTVKCSSQSQQLAERYLKALDLTMDVVAEAPAVQHTKGSLTASKHWAVGDKISHSILGFGEIIKLEREKIVIRFDQGGNRTFVSHLAQPHLSRVRCS